MQIVEIMTERLYSSVDDDCGGTRIKIKSRNACADNLAVKLSPTRNITAVYNHAIAGKKRKAIIIAADRRDLVGRTVYRQSHVLKTCIKPHIRIIRKRAVTVPNYLPILSTQTTSDPTTSCPPLLSTVCRKSKCTIFSAITRVSPPDGSSTVSSPVRVRQSSSSVYGA